MGTLITFYSYKGGVGRTMALANIATLLAMWSKSVLVIDWDLEAPGVEHFFFNQTEIEGVQQKPGLIDLLTDLSGPAVAAPPERAWPSLVVETPVRGTKTRIQMFHGRGTFRRLFSECAKTGRQLL